eukprot:NODE_309_length_3185_cov_28.403205.p1 GENE.NODE_309_length_3185_cov_28.403205~~NODE_309_length_3185_cov_28.403205.p1  ORF type:complete len:771 (+),score=97.55 NODE_309_length_3185_cov_28.403205:85-2397(+)
MGEERKNIIVKDDWCEDAQRCVEEGTDGFWLRIPRLQVACNPCTTCIATLLLFGFVLFCTAETVGDHCLQTVTSETEITLQTLECNLPSTEFAHWKTWVTQTFTWAYIGTQDMWIVFAIVLFFSKYGSVKLGPDDEPPEFTTYSWFAMIFSCGVASGLFFYSVAEPIWHYEPCGYSHWSGAGGTCTGDAEYANRYSTLNDNWRAQEAMNLTLYHWGLHGWVCYAVIGAVMGILHFRKNLPMSVKTTFYPLLGDRVYGFGGDCLDVMSIIGTTFGVCTSLGLATMQLNDSIIRRNGGQHWLGQPFYSADNYNDWKGGLDSYKTIWDGSTPAYQTSNPWFGSNGTVVTSTAATIAELVNDGNEQILLIWCITGLSTISLMLGLDYGIQFVGNFTFGIGLFLMWSIFMLDDTWYLANLFVQSVGHYLQWILQVGFYSGAFDMPDHSGPDGRQEYKSWMDGWTIFYWGWWISWAPLVGAFIGNISKGRTLREFFCGCIFGSTAFNFLWLVIFGGAGLRMEMAASKYGVGDDCSDETKNICREVDADRYTGEPIYFCSTLSRLSCYSATNMMPALFEQYMDIGIFLAALATSTCFLYFIASSDSGSLVDSMLASNGTREPARPQRLYWSLTEGAAATGLLYTGRLMPQDYSAAMKSLQAVSIVVGLPWTILICFQSVALWRVCQFETGDRKWGGGFKSSVVDVGFSVYTTMPDRQQQITNVARGKFDGQHVLQLLVLVVAPWRLLRPIWERMEEKKKPKHPERTDEQVRRVLHVE